MVFTGGLRSVKTKFYNFYVYFQAKITKSVVKVNFSTKNHSNYF